MEFSPELIESSLRTFFRRCEAARLAGGIAEMDVVNRTASVPEGWVLDPWINYYLPPGFTFSEHSH